MFHAKAAGLLAAFSFLLVGCACGLPARERVRLDAALAAAGFTHSRLAGVGLPVHAWLRPAAGEVLTVVIEGDGAAWFNPRWPPADPTPETSQAAALAFGLSGPVAYLGRPCQFEPLYDCHPAHWTSQRFSAELVARMDGALDELKSIAGVQRLRLIGHSGGGVMAVLIALRRNDVSSVLTLMAPLAVAEWTRKLELTPLAGLDPENLAALEVPAIHIAGGRDTIVPPGIIQAYVVAKGGKYLLWPEADHACWPVEQARDLVGSLP